MFGRKPHNLKSKAAAHRRGDFSSNTRKDDGIDDLTPPKRMETIYYNGRAIPKDGEEERYKAEKEVYDNKVTARKQGLDGSKASFAEEVFSNKVCPRCKTNSLAHRGPYQEFSSNASRFPSTVRGVSTHECLNCGYTCNLNHFDNKVHSSAEAESNCWSVSGVYPLLPELSREQQLWLTLIWQVSAYQWRGDYSLPTDGQIAKVAREYPTGNSGYVLNKLANLSPAEMNLFRKAYQGFHRHFHLWIEKVVQGENLNSFETSFRTAWINGFVGMMKATPVQHPIKNVVLESFPSHGKLEALLMKKVIVPALKVLKPF